MRLPAALAVSVLLSSVASRAQASDPASDAFRFFAEEGSATTALRRVGPTSGSPVPVDVVTAEEISASGAVHLWDLLRYRVGLDVIEGRSSGGANRAVVSVRGIPRDSTNELLVLLDGRSVYDPIGGSTLWERIPVQLQDIERIEIVRGPNAALYGSNAGLGVINIITRRPAATAAASLSASGGNRRFGEAAVAAETAADKWGVRASATTRSEAGEPSAADPSAQGHDFLHDHAVNLRAWGRAGETTLDAYAGASIDDYGKSFGAKPQTSEESNFQMLRLARPVGGDSSVEARVSRDESSSQDFPGAGGGTTTRTLQYDAEALQTVAWGGGRLQSTYGAEWRWAGASSNLLYGGLPLAVNRTLRGFLHQSVRVLPTVTVMGGLNHETATAGGYHKDYQAAVMWAPVETQTLRVSHSRANMKPQLIHRYANFDASAAVHVAGNTKLSPSPLTSWEAGWTGLFRDGALRLELTGFYTEIRDHINLDQTDGPSAVNLQYDNTNTVILRGLEASARWRVAFGRSVYANYTEETVADQDAHAIYLNTTPRHKVNLGFDWALPAGFRVSGNAGWKDAYMADSVSGAAQEAVPAFWRLDARVAWTATPSLELFVAGQNLEQPYRREFVDGLLVPRRILGGATVRFR